MRDTIGALRMALMATFGLATITCAGTAGVVILYGWDTVERILLRA